MTTPLAVGMRVRIVSVEEACDCDSSAFLGRTGVVVRTYEPAWGGGTMYTLKFDGDGIVANFEDYEIEVIDAGRQDCEGARG